MSKVRYIRAPKDLAPQLKGLYERVARKLGVDPSYVSRVARGETDSAVVIDALRLELARIADQGTKPASPHEVQFYTDDVVLLDRLVPFLAAPLRRSDAAIVVGTKSHRDRVVQRLKARGLDMGAAIRAGMFVAVDASETLSIFMVNDMPESARFSKFVGGLIEETVKTAKTAHPRMAVYGEWVSLLWGEGNSSAAIRLEQLWNELASNYEMDLLCGYDMSGHAWKRDDVHFQSVCAEHTAIYSQSG